MNSPREPSFYKQRGSGEWRKRGREMKTEQLNSQGRVRRRSILVILTAITLFSCSHESIAQQWNTNGNDISNANTGNVGIGTTSPAQKLEISSVSPLIQMSDTVGIKMTMGTVAQWSGFKISFPLVF